MDTLLDVGSAYIKSVSTFVQEVQKGVVDDEKDIQILAYQILHKTTTMLPLQMLEVLDSLPPLFMKGLVDMLKHAKGMDYVSPPSPLFFALLTISFFLSFFLSVFLSFPIFFFRAPCVFCMHVFV